MVAAAVGLTKGAGAAGAAGRIGLRLGLLEVLRLGARDALRKINAPACVARRTLEDLDVRCIECGRVAAKEARGWRAYIVDDPDDEGEELEVAIYCPRCAEREVGPSGQEDVA